jgi:hypothetical protein
VFNIPVIPVEAPQPFNIAPANTPSTPSVYMGADMLVELRGEAVDRMDIASTDVPSATPLTSRVQKREASWIDDANAKRDEPANKKGRWAQQ